MFKPKHVYIEKEALEYKLGKDLKKQFETMEIPVDILESNRVNFLRGKNIQEKYEIGKRVLVIGVRRTLEFQSLSHLHTINYHSLQDVSGNVNIAILTPILKTNHLLGSMSILMIF